MRVGVDSKSVEVDSKRVEKFDSKRIKVDNKAKNSITKDSITILNPINTIPILPIERL